MNLRVAVRELCEFTAKEGDLDLRFTPSPTAQEGMAGHATVVARRGPDYVCELPLIGEFEWLTVSGRADGFDPEFRLLEEIKTHRGDISRIPANHRLLHWAESQGRQHALKLALFEAYFTHCEDPSSRELLVRVAGQVGLDTTEAQRVLESGEFADEVREAEYFFQRAGIRSVPAIIVNQRHLISGGQPPDVFERALREIAAQADAPL